MEQFFSFKTIRFLCFSFLIILNLAGGAVLFAKLQAVAETIAAPIQQERPLLNKIFGLHKLTSELNRQLYTQFTGEAVDNTAAIRLIDNILQRADHLSLEEDLPADHSRLLANITEELKQLKMTLVQYEKKGLHDSASQIAETMFLKIDESRIKIEDNLNGIISLITRRISDSDINTLISTQMIQIGLISFLAIILSGTFIILYIFNFILSANLKKIIEGTQQLGQGNLDWRIDSRFDDEFGRLSSAFNEMAVKMTAAKQKILDQTEKIEQLAYYDALTDLPNRINFSNRLEQELARAGRNNENLGVIYIDLDDFKLVNDSFGHDIGDLLLREVAGRLKKHVRLSDTVSRLAGDEFAIILPHLNSYQDSVNIGQRIIGEISHPVDVSKRIIADLSQPFFVKSNMISLSCSVGIAVYPENGDTAQEILNSADSAMYFAKNEGKNRFKYCTEEMTLKMLELLDVEHSIRQATHNKDFILHFQPQIDLETNNIIGLEALIRWDHHQRGFIPPGDFIPIAEERGLIQDISKWIVGDVFNHLREWRKAGCRLVPVMINLSVRDFFQQGIEKFIFNVLEEEQEFKGLFGVEVTETGIMDDRENAVKTLHNLREMGVKIALDDFGTGHSSLNYLQFLPIDMVKIDRSFIKDIDRNAKNAAITQAVITLSHSLNLKVLVEGIETEEQLEFIRKFQCDYAQGFFFYKPLPASDIVRLLG